jgi:hypothetical protein
MLKRFLCVGLIAIASVATVMAQRPGFKLFTDPGQRFSVEFPNNWTWMIISGSQEPIATFVHPTKEAAVVVERFRMPVRLTPNDITDDWAVIEAENLKERQRGAQNIRGRVINRGTLRAAVIDYNRAGLSEEERVRMYSLPIGEDLYRVTCMSLASRFSRYEENFETIVSTLKSAEQLRR